VVVQSVARSLLFTTLSLALSQTPWLDSEVLLHYLQPRDLDHLLSISFVCVYV